MIHKIIKWFLDLFKSDFAKKLEELEQINKQEAQRIEQIKEQNQKFRNKYSGKRRYIPVPK
jgi:DNA topoisomerase IA